MILRDISNYISAESCFAVTLVCPENYIHSLTLLEVSETINYALLNLGIDSILTHSLDSSNRINIIIGGHLLDKIPDCTVPKGSIIYNFDR